MATLSQPVGIDRAHGGSVAEGCIDFSTSLNPLGPPTEAIQAYHEAATLISKYPSPYPRRLEARIASWLDADPETVIAANGSTQLIYLVARGLRLKSPFVVIPTFSEIANALIAAGSKPLPISMRPEDNFRFEFESLWNALERGADGVFLGRPNNPTGTLLGLEETAGVARECDRCGAWCIIDEAFIEFADDPRSVAAFIESIPKLVVVRSLTKIFAIPGLRLGYLLGPADFVRELRDTIDPWSVNAVAEHIAQACLDVAPAFIPETHLLIREQRLCLEGELGRLPGIKLFASSANFLMLSAHCERICGDFGGYMLSQGIAIRDLSTLPGCGSGDYRIGVRSHPDNSRLTTAAAGYFRG